MKYVSCENCDRMFVQEAPNQRFCKNELCVLSRRRKAVRKYSKKHPKRIKDARRAKRAKDVLISASTYHAVFIPTFEMQLRPLSEDNPYEYVEYEPYELSDYIEVKSVTHTPEYNPASSIVDAINLAVDNINPREIEAQYQKRESWMQQDAFKLVLENLLRRASENKSNNG